MLEKCVLTVLELNWNKRLGHKTEHLSSYADVVHTTAKQVISRRRKKLLGAYRINDILPYDRDADFSFLFSSNPPRAFFALKKNGMHVNGLQAR